MFGVPPNIPGRGQAGGRSVGRNANVTATLQRRHGSQTVRQNFIPEGIELVTFIELPVSQLVDSDVQFPASKLVVD